jgi:hypothetical protein
MKREELKNLTNKFETAFHTAGGIESIEDRSVK